MDLLKGGKNVNVNQLTEMTQSDAIYLMYKINFEEQRIYLKEEKMNRVYGKTTMERSARLAGLWCYTLGWVSGIFFLITERDNKFVRFHAFQSSIVFGAITILGVIFWFAPYIGTALGVILFIVSSILWRWMMYLADKGEMVKVPVAGKIAEQLAYPRATKSAANGISFDFQKEFKR